MNDSVTFIVDAFNGVALPTQTPYPSYAPSSATVPTLATKTVSTPNATATGAIRSDGTSNAVSGWLLGCVCFSYAMFL
jgi:hypothetical protein